jgi:hypothetical protein
MAAPHGACSEAMMGDMASLGFEGACISYGSLKAHNPDSDWTRRIGVAIAENINRLTVIPRWNLRKTTRTGILLAAFLHQPIILVGHHDDLSGGLACLEQAAGWINALPGVQWLDLKAIARSNYYSRREEETIHLALYSGRAHITIPPEVTALRVTCRWPAALAPADWCWTMVEQNGTVTRPGDGDTIAVKPGTEVQAVVRHQESIDPSAVPLPRPNVWPVVRRQLTEARDRLLPLRPRWLRRPSAY